MTWHQSLTDGAYMTAARLRAHIPRLEIRPTDQTSTIIAAEHDDALFVPVEAESVYLVTMVLIVSETSGTSGDVRTDWQIPPGANLDDLYVSRMYLPIGGTSVTSTNVGLTGQQWTSASGAGAVTTATPLYTSGVLATGVNPGELRLLTGKWTSSATTAYFAAGSWLRVERIG